MRAALIHGRGAAVRGGTHRHGQPVPGQRAPGRRPGPGPRLHRRLLPAILDGTIEPGRWLEDGDTISASEWVTPYGLVAENPALDGATTTVWLSGGVLGQVHRVTNRITTAAGRIDDRSMEVFIAVR